MEFLYHLQYLSAFSVQMYVPHFRIPDGSALTILPGILPAGFTSVRVYSANSSFTHLWLTFSLVTKERVKVHKASALGIFVVVRLRLVKKPTSFGSDVLHRSSWLLCRYVCFELVLRYLVDDIDSCWHRPNYSVV